MKRKSFILILLAMILMHGCLIKSLHPFFKTKDILFQPSLVGKWMDQDSSFWEIEQNIRRFSLFGRDTLNNYIIRMKEENKESVFIGTLFKLNGIHYLDFYPLMEEMFDDEFFTFHLLPTHSLAKVDFQGNNNVKISWFNENWLTELFEQNKVKISHQKVKINNEDGYILTASTDELQKFIVKYGHNPDIYQCDNDGICIILNRTL